MTLSRSALLVHFAALLAAWVAAWLLKRGLDRVVSFSPFGAVLFWTAMKLVVWIAPCVALLVRAGRRPVSYLRLVLDRRAIAWAGGVSLVLAAANLAVRRAEGEPLGFPEWSAPLASVLVVTPVLEEVLMRGYFLRAFEDAGAARFRANLAVSLLFLGLHVPGWAFTGAFSSPDILRHVPTIFVLGLLFGFVRQRSGSTLAAVVVHSVNNLFGR